MSSVLLYCNDNLIQQRGTIMKKNNNEFVENTTKALALYADAIIKERTIDPKDGHAVNMLLVPVIYKKNKNSEETYNLTVYLGVQTQKEANVLNNANPKSFIYGVSENVPAEYLFKNICLLIAEQKNIKKGTFLTRYGNSFKVDDIVSECAK